jgi:hypothetical protein
MSDQQSSVEEVIKDLEQKVNPKSIQDGIALMGVALKNNNSTILVEPMKKGAEEFKERVGRNMTYSEMRAMWG